VQAKFKEGGKRSQATFSVLCPHLAWSRTRPTGFSVTVDLPPAPRHRQTALRRAEGADIEVRKDIGTSSGATRAAGTVRSSDCRASNSEPFPTICGTHTSISAKGKCCRRPCLLIPVLLRTSHIFLLFLFGLLFGFFFLTGGFASLRIHSFLLSRTNVPFRIPSPHRMLGSLSDRLRPAQRVPHKRTNGMTNSPFW
jgi:hypothetical protein